MSGTRLTDARVRDLRPKKTTGNVRDTFLAGFGVRILPGGQKRFFIHVQHEGQRTWRIVGDPADMTVVEARERARGMLAAVRTGRPATDAETLFGAVAERAFRRLGRNWKPGTLSRNRHYFRKRIPPRFAGRQVAGITRRDVRDWFAPTRATPVTADWSMPVLSVIMKAAEADGLRPEGSAINHLAAIFVRCPGARNGADLPRQRRDALRAFRRQERGGALPDQPHTFHEYVRHVVWYDPLNFVGKVIGGQMRMGLRRMRICVVDRKIRPNQSGHCPQCLLGLPFIAARDADVRGLPQMLKRVVDEPVSTEGIARNG